MGGVVGFCSVGWSELPVKTSLDRQRQAPTGRQRFRQFARSGLCAPTQGVVVAIESRGWNIPVGWAKLDPRAGAAVARRLSL